jgi:hypothetical protein
MKTASFRASAKSFYQQAKKDRELNAQVVFSTFRTPLEKRVGLLLSVNFEFRLGINKI